MTNYSEDGPVLAFTVNVDGSCVEEKLTFEQIQERVGGYVEAVYSGDRDTVALVNENGLGKQLPVNVAALEAFDALDFAPHIIVGNVVFVGNGGDDFADITKEALTTLTKGKKK